MKSWRNETFIVILIDVLCCFFIGFLYAYSISKYIKTTNESLHVHAKANDQNISEGVVQACWTS